jgi:hypothetical protein
MSNEKIDPRKIVIDSDCPLEVTLRDSIQELGLAKLQETIRVRMGGDAYKAVSGAELIAAVLSLLEENAECYDAENLRTARASEVYRTVPVQVLG